MFQFVEPLPDRSQPAEVDGIVRKRRAGRSGAASLPVARRRRTTTSTWRWASSWASKRTDTWSTSAAPIPTFSQPATHVHGKVPTNDDGFMIRLGTQNGFRARWYCGRILDPSDIPGASDQCGPEGGPQCHSCARYQTTFEPDLNDDGFPVKRSTSTKACFMFYCDRLGVVAGTGGKCGPDGPQCPSCQRLQQSFKADYVNDEQCAIYRGTTEGYTGMYYCGRVLGVKMIPGSDGRCGPADGPQCPSCKRFQLSQQIVIDDEPKSREKRAATATDKTVQPTAPQPTAKQPAQVMPAASTKVKREIESPAQHPDPPGSKASRRQDVMATHGGTGNRAEGRASPEKDSRESLAPTRGRPSTITQKEVMQSPPTKGSKPPIVCSVCGLSDRPEELLLCDAEGPGCHVATHLGCCNPPLRAVPAGDWYCAACQLPKENAKNRILCSVCGLSDRPEQLLLCDGMKDNCEGATHLGCCRPPLAAIPEGDWFCGSCQSQSKRKGRPPKSAVQAAKPVVSAGTGKGIGKGGGKGAVQSLGAALKVAAAQVPRPRTLD